MSYLSNAELLLKAHPHATQALYEEPIAQGVTEARSPPLQLAKFEPHQLLALLQADHLPLP
jgi:hypothetical protein